MLSLRPSHRDRPHGLAGPSTSRPRTRRTRCARSPDVATIGQSQRLRGVLFDQKDRRSSLADLFDDRKDLVDDHRGQAIEGSSRRSNRGSTSTRGRSPTSAVRHRGSSPAVCDGPSRWGTACRSRRGRRSVNLTRERAHLEILFHGHHGKNAAAFRHVTDAHRRELVGLHLGDVASSKVTEPSSAREVPTAFAASSTCRPVGTEQRDDLTLLDVEGDAVQGLDRSVSERRRRVLRALGRSFIGRRTQVGLDHGGIRTDPGRRALGEDAAKVQYVNAFGE